MSNTIKHTPGPWYYEIEDYDYEDKIATAHIMTRSTSIALVSSEKDICDHENAANARLIATAPDLLEVCKVAVERLAGYDGAWEALSPAQRSLVNLLKETIQKAEGNKI